MNHVETSNAGPLERSSARDAVLAARDRVATSSALSRSARKALGVIVDADAARADPDQVHTVTPAAIVDRCGLSRALALRAYNELVNKGILDGGLEDDCWIQWPVLADLVGLEFPEAPHRRRVRLACTHSTAPRRARARMVVRDRGLQRLADTSLLSHNARHVLSWMIELEEPRFDFHVVPDSKLSKRAHVRGWTRRRLATVLDELEHERLIRAINSQDFVVTYEAIAALLELGADRTPTKAHKTHYVN